VDDGVLWMSPSTVVWAAEPEVVRRFSSGAYGIPSRWMSGVAGVNATVRTGLSRSRPAHLPRCGHGLVPHIGVGPSPGLSGRSASSANPRNTSVFTMTTPTTQRDGLGGHRADSGLVRWRRSRTAVSGLIPPEATSSRDMPTCPRQKVALGAG
jgi:hypothetical protein